MAEGHLIRNDTGQVAGYALVGEEKILLRMHGGAGSACVAAYSANREVVYEVPYDGKEHAFEWTLGRLERLTIRRCEERIVNHKEVKDAQINENEKETGKAQTLCKKHARSSVYKGKKVMGQRACMTRWPPPPCWPTARYVDGVWREGGG